MDTILLSSRSHSRCYSTEGVFDFKGLHHCEIFYLSFRIFEIQYFEEHI